MATTVITFPVRIGRPQNTFGKITHPSGLAVHGDGYVIVEGCTREEAREVAFQVFDHVWAFDYDYANFASDLYKAGCLGKIIVSKNDFGNFVIDVQIRKLRTYEIIEEPNHV